MKEQLVPVSLTGKCLLPEIDGSRFPYDDFFTHPPIDSFTLSDYLLFTHTHTHTFTYAPTHMHVWPKRHFDQSTNLF